MRIIKARDAIIEIKLADGTIQRYNSAIERFKLSSTETYSTDRIYMPRFPSSHSLNVTFELKWWNVLWFGINYGFMPKLGKHEFNKRKIRKYLLKKMYREMKREKLPTI